MRSELRVNLKNNQRKNYIKFVILVGKALWEVGRRRSTTFMTNKHYQNGQNKENNQNDIFWTTDEFPEINMFQMRAYRAKKSESGQKERVWNMLISGNDCMDDY